MARLPTPEATRTALTWIVWSARLVRVLLRVLEDGARTFVVEGLGWASLDGPPSAPPPTPKLPGADA